MLCSHQGSHTHLFPLFQWHACRLAISKRYKAKCMTTINNIYAIFIFTRDEPRSKFGLIILMRSMCSMGSKCSMCSMGSMSSMLCGKI